MTDKKKGLTRDQLSEMIAGSVKAAVADQVATEIAPLKEQQSEWMDKLRGDSQGARKSYFKAVEEDPAKKGLAAGRYIRALAFGRGDLDKAKFFVEKSMELGHWDDDLGDLMVKSLQAGDFTNAGFLIPDDFAAEVIELLRNSTIVRRAGPRVLPMPSGQLVIRRQDAAATATYIGEATNIPVSEPSGGQIVLTAKKLSALVPITNDLLSFTSGPSADEFVRDDLVQIMALREDLAFLRDDGLSSTPKGIRFWTDAAHLLASNGVTATQVEEDFRDLIQTLEAANVRMIKPVFFMNPRSKNHLMTLRDVNGGNLVFPEIRGADPKVFGIPVLLSNQVPANLGGGADETEIYLVDMADALIGESTGLEIAVDSSASYLEAGTMISAFQRDETLMRAIMRHDFAMRHDVSAAIVTDATWGS